MWIKSSLSILSFRQKAHEGRLALRKQITDLNTEIAKLNYLREKKDELPPHYLRLLKEIRV